jgi:2-haloacid dehalogenase
MAIDALKLSHQEILFAAFTGWDVGGAAWFGYPMFWVNRLNFPAVGDSGLLNANHRRWCIDQ